MRLGGLEHFAEWEERISMFGFIAKSRSMCSRIGLVAIVRWPFSPRIVASGS